MTENNYIPIKPSKLLVRELVPQILDEYSEHIAKLVIEELSISKDEKLNLYKKYKEQKPSIITNHTINNIYRHLQNNNI
jgi:hypothetical protein